MNSLSSKTLRAIINIGCLFLPLLCFVTVFAQTSPADESLWRVPRTGSETITEPSPEATAMRRYTDYPIGYATGTVDISIPLVELPGGTAGVNIGLSYHTGGIKRQDISTSIGLGWTMTGLGSVSRQINGFPDEWRGDSYYPVQFWLNEKLDKVDILTGIIEAKVETELDRYYYNFPGHSGCFYLINDKIVQTPEKDVVIERVPNTINNNATEAFIITTPDGSKFRFDEKEVIDFRINDSPQPSPYYKRDYENTVTTWHLSRINGPESIYTIYSYNADGHVTAQLSTTRLPGKHYLSMHAYSLQGHEVFRDERITGVPGCHLRQVNEYDALGNILSSTTKQDNYNNLSWIDYIMARRDEKNKDSEFEGEETEEQETEDTGDSATVTHITVSSGYSYDRLGRLSAISSNTGKGLMYGYDMRGRLTSISNTAFSQKLFYEDPSAGFTPCYNGNLSGMKLSYGNDAQVSRRFTYDKLDRMTAMTSTDGFNTAYSYSLNSSPLTVSRHGLMSDGTTGPVDDLVMSYDGNWLVKAVEYADPVLLENSMDFAALESHYSYDSDGRLTADTGRGITEIVYAPNDRPVMISTDNGATFCYDYNATGEKLARHYSTLTGTGSHWYIGSFELSSEDKSTPALERINTTWGYIAADGKAYTYVSDYQGNIRAVIRPGGQAVQTTDYYPYGMPMATSTGADQNRYKYSGKELETSAGLNQYDFEARQYAPAIPLFQSPDPKAADYPGLNPYLYCAGNPMRYIDPNGERLYYQDGEIKYEYSIDNDMIAVHDPEGNMVDISSLSQVHQKTIAAMNELIATKTGMEEVANVINSDKSVTMKYDEKKGNTFRDTEETLYFNPDKITCGISRDETSGAYIREASASVCLSHEMGHAEDWVRGTLDNSLMYIFPTGEKAAKSEIYACWRENQYRSEIGYPQRVSYGVSTKNGKYFPHMPTALVTVKGISIYINQTLNPNK